MFTLENPLDSSVNHTDGGVRESFECNQLPSIFDLL
jgi:hypothetical protein